MLVRASRDGDLEVVLRLLYTNPFIDGQEQQLRNALWEAVRCRQLEVLRSLLEFRVDPASSPSPDLSRPPASLQNTAWTPLLALAVDGCEKRAQIVAELVSRRGGDSVAEQSAIKTVGPSTTPFITIRPPGAVVRPGFVHDSSPSPSAAVTVATATSSPTPTPRSGKEKEEAEEFNNPEDLFTTVPSNRRIQPGGRHNQVIGNASKHLANVIRRSSAPGYAGGGGGSVAGAVGGINEGSAGSAAGSATTVSNQREAAIQCSLDAATRKEFELLAVLLAQSGQAEQDARLHPLDDDALATLESRLEGALRTVRAHRHQRWEQQLMSVQRRHAEECRGRQSLEDEQACVVCSEEGKSVLFMPCRHLCTCERCAVKLSACPICRAVIEESVKCIKP